MKQINKEELELNYYTKLKEAQNNYEKHIENARYGNITDCPNFNDGRLWKDCLFATYDNFDQFINHIINQMLLQNDLCKLQSSDAEIRKVTRKDMSAIKFGKNNKKEKEIRKILYDDAKRLVQRGINKKIDLDDFETIKELWLDCKIDIRNSMDKLFNEISKLKMVENLINCRNNL